MSTLSPSHQHHLLQISSNQSQQQQQQQHGLPTIMESMDHQSNHSNSLVPSKSQSLSGGVPPLPPLRLPSALAQSNAANQLSSSSQYLPMISEESTLTANVAIVTSPGGGGTLPRHSSQTPLTSTPLLQTATPQQQHQQQYYANSQFNHYNDHQHLQQHLQSQSMDAHSAGQQQQQQLNSISSQMGHLV